MDYDKTKVPAAYDAARGYSPAIKQLWLDALSDHVNRDQVASILDLGCGTGRFSAALAEHFGAALTGVDPSEKMLAQARDKNAGKRAMTFLAGSGDAVPLESASVDLVFMSMIYHHLPDPVAMARECRRVLRPGSQVFLRNATVEQIESEVTYRFFTGLHEILTAGLPKSDAIAAVFEEAGFAVEAQGVVRPFAPTRNRPTPAKRSPATSNTSSFQQIRVRCSRPSAGRPNSGDRVTM